MSIRICHVVGARPNYMKAAPVYRALAGNPQVEQIIVHTGQHYNFNMSDVFFQQLEMPAPDFNLEVGSGTHAQQTADILSRFEPVVRKIRPRWVVVYGDVNSTIAAALACAKLGIATAHVEAGLRSFDRSMPEEVNRLLTDQICDLLFTPSEDGNVNLVREGISDEKIHLVGNVMIDTLVRMLPKARQHAAAVPRRFTLVTLHRPSNVDDFAWLADLLATLEGISDKGPVLFPVHPRTRRGLDQVIHNEVGTSRVRLMEPLPYLEFLALQQSAELVITDSGGIQEEATFLGVPCLTVRENTERPITVEVGTNILVGRDLQRLRLEAEKILGGTRKPGRIPPLWDGHAAERIAKVILEKSPEPAGETVEAVPQTAR
jgi:UDP-N-acetylglucosamine 2-epimerase (non-hydrolysing)